MVCRALFLLEKKGRFGRFPVSPYGKALSDAFWCRSKQLFCTEPSNSPVLFSSCKTPFRQRLHLASTFFSIHPPKEKGQEEISRPEFMSI